MAKKITMQQIADYLGVSKYVVSKALSGKEGVNEETRKKVLETAGQLGYSAKKKGRVNEQGDQQSIQANSEPTEKKEKVVLVIMQNVHVQTRESSYWGKIIDGISSTIEKYGFQMVLLTEIYIGNIGSVVNLNGFVGVITVGYVAPKILLDIEKNALPIIMIDYEDPLIPCDTVFNNNFDASFHLTSYLHGLGHKKFQFVGDIQYSRSFFDRYNGVRSCLESKGLFTPFSTELLSIKGANFNQQFNDWLSVQTEMTLPTAFVCANDQVASTVISLLQSAGYSVPLDFSVTGFDNTDLSYNQSPTITTVNVAKFELGKRSVEFLKRRLNEQNASYEKLLISGQLVLRDSTTSPQDTNNSSNN